MSKVLGTLLILTVGIVLLALLFTGSQSVLVVSAVIIVLVTMILVIGDAKDQLPHVLQTVIDGIRNILHP